MLFVCFDFGCNTRGGTGPSQNEPPTIRIIEPAAGSIFNEEDTVVINVLAGDSDGFVNSVSLYANDDFHSTDNDTPYSFVWVPQRHGVYVLWACATDDGGVSSSDSVDIRVSYAYEVPQNTGDGWDTAHLTDVGIDMTPLLQLVDRLDLRVYEEVHSVLIVKDGKLAFELYYPGHDFGLTGTNFHDLYVDFGPNTWHNTHSATKSVTSALVGIAIDRGLIDSIETPIFTFLDDYDDLRDADKEKITVEHLLTMTSGLEWNEWDVTPASGEHDINLFNSAADPIRYLLSKPVVTEPGTAFYYNGGTVDLLGEIVHIVSGVSVQAFSARYLFMPMGIQNYQWQRLWPSNLTCCHGDIYIRPRDMAKFGLLFLNRGVWNGQRLISEAWVEESLDQRVALPWVRWADGYGYLWWLETFHVDGRDFESFRAEGWGGQFIVVFPDVNMVVVFTGANYVSDPPCREIIVQYILPAIG